MSPPPDDKNVDNEDFASLLAEYDAQHPVSKKSRGPKTGDLVKGRVVTIGHEAVFIDLGAKSEGAIDLAEVRDANGKITVALGDELEARVVSTDDKTGTFLLRKTMGRGPDGKNELEQAFAHQIPVEGVVTAINKGGVDVMIAGVRAFCPISQLDARRTEDASGFIGQKLQFLITRCEPGRGRDLNLVVSRRSLVESESRARAEAMRGQLEVGAIVEGKVSTIKDYGAFIDLGGVEGMLHVSEIGFQRVGHPSEVLSVGQTVTVQILKMEKSTDAKKPERISLSLKSLSQDPWKETAARFVEGVRASGKVLRVETFGAFVELAPGVEGLLHISELGAGRQIRHAKEVLKPGQAVEVKVLAVDAERRRLSLGLAGPIGMTADDDREEGAARTVEKAHLGTFGDLFKKK